MDSSLELATRLSVESEYKSLYAWFIEEFKSGGETLTGKWIPWPWSLYFRASSLKRVSVVRRDGYSDTRGVNEQDFIKCQLDSLGGEFDRPVAYSMLGTNRRTDELTLEIHRLPEGDAEERCIVGGMVQWTHKEEFSTRSTTLPDELYLTVYINDERYEHLLDAIGDGKDTQLTLMTGGVSGFYSHWSPDIKTGYIKVLTSLENQKIEIPEHCMIKPPVLGKVSRFSVSVVRTIRPEMVQDAPDGAEDFDKLPVAPPPQPWAPLALAIAARLDQLKYTLWVIIAATVLLLIFRR